MSNNVKNVLKFRNLKPKDIDFILNTIANCTSKDDFIPIIEYEIDFNKIIPEPRTIEECPKDCIVESAKEAHIEEDEERPWFDWYNFHCKYWGTKWNAYDCYTKIGKSYIQFVFETAWAPPIPIIESLNLLKYDIDYKYADENYGYNCGIHIYRNGILEELDTEETISGSTQFAMNLWKTY